MKLFLSLIIFWTSVFGWPFKQARDIQQIEVIALPQRLLVRTAIATEERFDTIFNDIKTRKILPKALIVQDSIENIGKSRGDFQRIDIRAKLVVKYKDGTTKSLLVDGFGQVQVGSKIYAVNNYIKRLVWRD